MYFEIFLERFNYHQIIFKIESYSKFLNTKIKTIITTELIPPKAISYKMFISYVH